jgi:hypothetical protein
MILIILSLSKDRPLKNLNPNIFLRKILRQAQDDWIERDFSLVPLLRPPPSV